MASFGRLTNALVNLKPELSLGLAHINFDFSLMKVEAPASYQGVGQAISHRRRDGAEDGSMHVTARRLGALFRSHIPDTPLLIDAYGKRATEIARSDIDQGKNNASMGAFNDFFGSDATSIWAAATSGSNAIAVHLLACMLARVWTPAEAVSIWVELVQAQRDEIMEQFSRGGQDFDRYLAALPEIDRTALSEWDSSARAWIRRADQVMKEKQKGVQVALSNLDMSVGISSNTLSSVLVGWKDALRGMECLLSNQAQIINDGSLALALSCWHLYPNLDIPDGETVVQQDPLFAPEAEAILGLQASPGQQPRGVYWSLSLSKLRFYGAPEYTTQHVNIDTNRLDLEQFRFVALGCVVHTWTANMTSIDKVCLAISQLYNLAVKDTPASLTLPWISILGHTAEEFLNARNPRDRTYLMKLINLGRGRGKMMLGDPTEHPSFAFGLADQDIFVSCIKQRKHSIEVLRRIARRRFPGASPGDIIIQYVENEAVPAPSSAVGGGTSKAKGSVNEPEPTRTLPHHKSSDSIKKGSVNVKLTDELGHATTPTTEMQPRKGDAHVGDGNILQNAILTRKVVQYTTAIVDSDGHHHRWLDSATTLQSTAPAPLEAGTKEILHLITPRTRRALPDFLGSSPDKKDSEHLSSSDTEQTLPEASSEGPPIRSFDAALRTLLLDVDDLKSSVDNPHEGFECDVGHPEQVALYVRKPVLEAVKTKRRAPYWVSKAAGSTIITPDDVIRGFHDGIFDPKRLADALLLWIRTAKKDQKQYQYLRSLCTLFWIDFTYRSFGDTTIDPGAVVRPLSSARWFVDRQIIRSEADLKPLSREEAFGCIGYLECLLDAELSTFENAMAISSGDSIFVSTTLVCDPLEGSQTVAVKRLLGNFGKPGIVLLVPPPSPMSLQPDPSSWQLIENEPFCGQFEDRFADTTLRMSFTGWEAPVQIPGAPTGRPFVEAHIVETLISVYSRSKWIADLDVLTAVHKASKFPDYPTFLQKGCDHEDKGQQSDIELTAINTWEGFLDSPPGPSVVMTYRNWLARLAMVAMAVPRGDRVVLSDGICWKCYHDLYELGGPELMQRALFIAYTVDARIAATIPKLTK